MNNYVVILLWLSFAEVVRRCCLLLVRGFTGPLSKVPGPFLWKLSKIPWTIENMRGNQINISGPLFQKYGDVVRVAPDTVLVAGKANIQKVLVDEDLVKAPVVAEMRLHLAIPSLLTDVDKATHKHARRLLSHGFSATYLNGLEPLMQQCCDHLQTFLDSECEKGSGSTVINAEGVLSNLTFDVMSATSFGGSFNLVTSKDAGIKKEFTDMLMKIIIHSRIPFLRYLPAIPPIMGAEINQLLKNIIVRRKSETGPVKKDIVQIIMDAHEADPVAYSDQRVQDEIAFFMVAGSETTGASTTVTIFQLVNNPQKMKILVKEIDAAFPSRDDPVTFIKTQDLPYLNAVILEGMRLMVIPGAMLRYTTKPLVLGGYKIPPETTVQPWVHAVDTDPRIWPDANSFIPERWLGEYKGVTAQKKDLLVFSAGSRNCIGEQFALREMRLILARLLRRYEISLVEGQSHERRHHLTPWFLQGFYNVGVKPRK